MNYRWSVERDDSGSGEIIITMDQEERAAGMGKPAPQGHDGDPRWRVTLYTMWVAQLFAMIGFAFVMPFMPFYIRELGVTDPRLVPIWAGLLVTGSGVMMSLAAPVWGWVADRHGRKLMVQRAMFGGALILSLMAGVHNVRQLLVLRTLQGAVTGTVAATVALISTVVPRAYMGFSLGLIQMSVFVGGSLGPLLGGAAAEKLGYRLPFVITGGMLFIGGVLVLFGAKERFTRPSKDEQAKAGSIREVLQTPGVVMLLSVFTLMNLSGSFVGPIFPLFVEKVVGQPGRAASATGLILAVTGVTSALAALVVGRMSDRLGHKPVLVVCTAFTGLMCLPQAAAQSVGQLLVMRAIFGLGAGGMVPAMNAMVTTLVPRTRLGQAYGITTTASSLGWSVGPIIGGWAASALGLRVPFVLMGVSLLVLAAIAQKGVRSAEAAETPPAQVVPVGSWLQETSDAMETE